MLVLVATAVPGWVWPRLVAKLPSTRGSNALRAAAWLARADCKRAPAWATLALASCAASSKSSKSGSPCACHQPRRLLIWPWCGSGACHCGLTGAATVLGGRLSAQPESQSAPSASQAVGRVRRKPRSACMEIRFIDSKSAAKHEGKTGWRKGLAKT